MRWSVIHRATMAGLCAAALSAPAALGQDQSAEVRALREQVAELRQVVAEANELLTATRRDLAEVRATQAGAEADAFRAERQKLDDERRALARERALLQATRDQLQTSIRSQASRYENLPRPAAPPSSVHPAYSNTQPYTTRSYSTTVASHAPLQIAYGVGTYYSVGSGYPRYAYNYGYFPYGTRLWYVPTYRSAFYAHPFYYPRAYYPYRYHSGISFGYRSSGFRFHYHQRF